MKLRELSLKDKELFERYLGLRPHRLSVYAFTNIYIWKALLKVSWGIVSGSLCVFFADRTGCFLYLPPLGKVQDPEVIAECFRVMDAFNRNREVSRVENLEEEQLGWFREAGYRCYEKPGEYLCSRSALAGLRGERLKHKRASVNYFSKHYRYSCEEFFPGHRKECLGLYLRWMRERAARNSDRVYCGMLRDSLKCLRRLLADLSGLPVRGKVVLVDGRVEAFSLGFELSPDTFCILYEVADLSFKGIGQFIFREFCRSLPEYRYINIMDDSGLENLKKVKLSYCPEKIIPAYVASRKNEP